MRAFIRTILCTCAFAFALDACADKATMPEPTDDPTATVVLSAEVLSLLPSGTTDLDVWIGYVRTNGSRIALREVSVHLADVAPPVSIDVDATPCLADPQHSGPPGICEVHIALVARGSSGTRLDSVSVNSTVTPGTQETINIDLPDLASIGVDDTVRVVAPSELGAGGTISFVSSDTSIATVTASGLVTGHNVGRVSIRMSSGTSTASARLRIAPRADHAVAVGDKFACALDASGEAWCWGAGTSGQLGDGTNVSRSTPQRVGGSLAYRAIAASGTRACAVSVAFRLYCWGQDPLQTSSAVFAPTPLSSTERFESVALSFEFGCALTSAKRAFCFGRNRNGVFGRGDTVSSAAPVPVSGGLSFSTVVTNLNAACGLAGTTAYCWGTNGFSMLGTGTASSSFVPVAVSGGLAFATLWGGSLVNCGITSAGTAYCWGTSFGGAMGNGSTAGVTVPTPVALSGTIVYRQVVPTSANSFIQFTCGLDAVGSAYCWGINSAGQLGTTTTLPSTCTPIAAAVPCVGTPTPVTTSERFLTIQNGGESTCAITTTYALRCWGANESGQLGDGTTTNRATPTAVSGQLRLR